MANYGDFSNFGDDIDDFRHKSKVLAEHCDTDGRDFDEIGRTCHRMSVIGRDDADLGRKLAVAARRRACEPEEFAEEHFVATVSEAVQEMGEFVDEGCSDMILYFYDMGEGDSMELFGLGGDPPAAMSDLGRLLDPKSIAIVGLSARLRQTRRTGSRQLAQASTRRGRSGE